MKDQPGRYRGGKKRGGKGSRITMVGIDKNLQIRRYRTQKHAEHKSIRCALAIKLILETRKS
jgi:hypothetical protein